jgi:hypothetical protein
MANVGSQPLKELTCYPPSSAGRREARNIEPSKALNVSKVVELPGRANLEPWSVGSARTHKNPDDIQQFVGAASHLDFLVRALSLSGTRVSNVELEVTIIAGVRCCLRLPLAIASARAQ